MRARAMLAGLAAVAGVLAGIVAPPVLAVTDASSEFAVIGPVRYTESSGVQDAVYGASFVVIGDAYAENVITGDDTIILTLTGATSGTGKVWLSQTNRLFPAGGGLADDTLTLMDPTSPPASVGSGHPFSIVRGDTDDDTILQTYIAVSAPGTYVGDVYIYEGTSPTMSPETVVQHTKFRFTTARAPRTISVDPDSLDLIATPVDVQSTTVQLLDDSGHPTQMAVSDRIVVTTSDARIASPGMLSLTAPSFDDSLKEPLGSATLPVSGGSLPGAATITLDPQGTLASSGVTATTIPATSIPLTTRSPGLFEMVFPQEQRIIDEARSTDDTAYYIVNDLFVTNLLLVAKDADPDSGVVGYVSTSQSNWRGLIVAGGAKTPVEQIDDSATDTPVVFASGSDGTVDAAIAWQSVTEGAKITLRTGTGAATKWTVIQVEEPTPKPRTSPSGRIISKVGDPIDFIVTLQDDFGNAYSNFRVSAQARSSRGTPVGPESSWATTDEDGRAMVYVDPPDDTHVGPATIVFTVTLPGGLPYPALTPPVVRVTYSESGLPSALTVAQAQSTPSTITPTTVQTAIPHVLVPFTGRAATSAGTPGTWTLPTASNPAGSGAAAGTMVTFTPTSVPAAQIEVRAPEGVMLSTSSRADWDGGASEVMVDSGSPVYAFSTQVGTHTIEFGVGSLVNDVQMRVSTSAAAASQIRVTPESLDLGPGYPADVSLQVTDPFGNPVPSLTGLDIVAQANAGYFSSGTNVFRVQALDDSGSVTISYISSTRPGSYTIDITGTGGLFGIEHDGSSGLPAPLGKVTLPLSVTAPPPAPEMVIIGERQQVGGRPGIEVSGYALNLPGAGTVTPWVRFQGQTKFTRGSAVITPDEYGDFTWTRRTSKSLTVYMQATDGTFRSNRVTIR